MKYIYYNYGKYNSKAKLVGDFNTLQQVSYVPEAMEYVRYLLSDIYKVIIGKLEFLERSNVNNQVVFKFVIRANDRKINCFLNASNGEIKLASGIEYYVFEPILDSLVLKEFSTLKDGIIVIERFSVDKLEIEMHYRDNGKVILFKIPIKNEEVFSIDTCLTLDSSTDLIKMRQFYQKYFYPNQAPFDRENHTTTFSIFDASGMQHNDPYALGTKLDEWEIGATNHYQLSEIRDGILVTLKDGEFTIKGYPLYLDSNTNVNEMMNDLAVRQRSLN